MVAAAGAGVGEGGECEGVRGVRGDRGRCGGAGTTSGGTSQTAPARARDAGEGAWTCAPPCPLHSEPL